MAPEMPTRDVELRRDGLAGAADLPLHGQPARRRRSAATRRARRRARRRAACASARCSCALMPRPTATMRSACDRSTACRASWNGASGCCRIATASIATRERAHGRGGRSPRATASARNAPIWNDDEVRRRSQRHDVGGQLALEHRPRERGAPPSRLMRVHVGDERAIEPRRKRRREVARLVGVRQQHERRRQLAIRRCERLHEPVGRVARERRVRRA